MSGMMFCGMDVHKESVTIAVFDDDGQELPLGERGEIAFDRVTFGYKAAAAPLYKDFTLIVAPAVSDLVTPLVQGATPLILILLGCFTKSAQFPFHFWLPHAMAAPTPVSAYLHSATMVKAGLFLMARLWPVLAGTELWFWIVAPVGLATMVIGAWIALFKNDLKAILAYSTVSHLGFITMLLGFGEPAAAVAAVFHILNHATFKCALFMTAGIVDHEAGTRDPEKLGGLLVFMPITGTIAIVTALSMAGVPPLNGFISKEMMLESAWHETAASWAFPAFAALGALFSVAYSLRYYQNNTGNFSQKHIKSLKTLESDLRL